MMKTKTFILILVTPAILVLLFLLLFNSTAKAAPGLRLGMPSAVFMQQKENENTPDKVATQGNVFFLPSPSSQIVSNQYKSNRN